MKTLIACLIAVALAAAVITPARADDAAAPAVIDTPTGIDVSGCPDYAIDDNRVRQLCDIAGIPPRDRLSVTEFRRAFRGAGGGSEGGSDDIDAGH